MNIAHLHLMAESPPGAGRADAVGPAGVRTRAQAARGHPGCALVYRRAGCGDGGGLSHRGARGGVGRGASTFDEDMVERHEAVALGTTAVMVVTGALAAAALWAFRRGSRLTATATRLVLAGLIAGSVAVAATAWTAAGQSVIRKSARGYQQRSEAAGTTTAGVSAGRVSRRSRCHRT